MLNSLFATTLLMLQSCSYAKVLPNYFKHPLPKFNVVLFLLSLVLPQVIHLWKNNHTQAGRKDVRMDNEIMKERGNSSRLAKTERQYLIFASQQGEHIVKIGYTKIKRTKQAAWKQGTRCSSLPSCLFKARRDAFVSIENQLWKIK